MVLVIIAATVITFVSLAINEVNYIKKTNERALLKVFYFFKKIHTSGRL